MPCVLSGSPKARPLHAEARPRRVRKAKAHEEPIRGPKQPAATPGRPANSVCEQWEPSSTKTSCRSERLGEGGRERGGKGQARSKPDSPIRPATVSKHRGAWCLEELAFPVLSLYLTKKYIRLVHLMWPAQNIWAEVIDGSAAARRASLTAALTIAPTFTCQWKPDVHCCCCYYSLFSLGNSNSRFHIETQNSQTTACRAIPITFAIPFFFLLKHFALNLQVDTQ